MNLTKQQKAEIAFAIIQREQELREIRNNPQKFITQLEQQVQLFNEAMTGEPLLIVKFVTG